MNDARYRYLVQRMFDEELPPEVSYAVKGYLDTSEQGSNFYQILKELLEAVEQIPLPEELKPEHPERLSVHISERVSLQSTSFFRFVGRLFRRESKKKGNTQTPRSKSAELTLIAGGKTSGKRDAEETQTITNRLRAISKNREEVSESEISASSLLHTLKGIEPEKVVAEPPKTLADAIRQRMRDTKEHEAISGTFSTSDTFSTSATYSTSGTYSTSSTFSTVEPLPDPWEEYFEQEQETTQSFCTMEAFYTASESFSTASVTKTLDDVFSQTDTGSHAPVAEPPVELVAEPALELDSNSAQEPAECAQRQQFQSSCENTDHLTSAWAADYRCEMAETVPPTTIIGNVFTDDQAISQWISDGASFADTLPLSFIDVDPTIVQQPLFNAVPQDLFGADYDKAMSAGAQSIFESVPENLFGPQFERAVRKQERPAEPNSSPRPIPVDAIMDQLGKLFVGHDASKQTREDNRQEAALTESPRIVSVTPRGQASQTPAPPAASTPVISSQAPDPASPTAMAAPPAPVPMAQSKDQYSKEVIFDAPVIRHIARLKTTADDPNVPQGTIKSVGKFLLHDGTRERIAEMLNEGTISGRLKVLTAEASSEINGVLKSLEEYEGVIGSLIVGYDGMTLASTLPQSLDSELISAWALMSYISTSEVSGSIGYGRVYQIASRTSTGYVLLADFGQALLVTLCNNPASDALVPLMRKVMELTA